MEISALQKARYEYAPKLPGMLRHGIADICVKEGEETQSVADQEKIKALFPNTYGKKEITFQKGANTSVAKKQVVGVILGLLESVKADVPQAFVHEALPLKRLRCPHFPVLHEHLLFLLPPFCPATAGNRHLDPNFLLRVKRDGLQIGHIDFYLPPGVAVPADEEPFIVVVITVLRLICRLRLTNSTLQQAVKFTHSAHPTL